MGFEDASNFRERRIPADVIWLDIHYLDGYNPFTWDKERGLAYYVMSPEIAAAWKASGV